MVSAVRAVRVRSAISAHLVWNDGNNACCPKALQATEHQERVAVVVCWWKEQCWGLGVIVCGVSASCRGHCALEHISVTVFCLLCIPQEHANPVGHRVPA